MKTKQMTATQYANDIKKCSRQAVVKAIKEKKPQRLPNVVDYKKVGNYYILEVAI